jgi:hypothetical protein
MKLNALSKIEQINKAVGCGQQAPRVCLAKRRGRGVLSAILGLRPKQTARKKKYGTNAATRV